LKTVRKYGKQPFRIGILHGGPGASGDMRPVAKELSRDFGILEFLQTEKSVNGQIEELNKQLASDADFPVILIGHSWGAWLGFLFASQYPDLIKKLILISAGAFDNKYNADLMKIRLERLSQQDKAEVKKFMLKMDAGDANNSTFKQFGKLMTRVDSFNYQPGNFIKVNFDVAIFQSVWLEATGLRDSGQLINSAKQIKCPVVAIHGEYDPHPVDGVEKPLSNTLADFKMIRIEKCGHTPWKERYAKDEFFDILRKELI
jgi:pimeloyl-ACP methyl ester carboxylesterase